ncbi:FAD-dependent oxidoreductase [Cryobacterium tepidiphilum]|uniref:FAD-dependent oxidoreductase n=1 Tax=Cryobacterium tepidiphilum TaxID=2486026 RepID=A0A3M8LPP4_9MICO|nr:FAD-dependent oxidoreductase [Cryobacterium tepidiphilum]
MMLGLLLARAGVEVIVLEKHDDFFRDFRGDTIHPSTIDLIDQLGLRHRFDGIPQSHIHTLDVVVNGNRLTPIDFGSLRGPNRSIALMPQWDFLNLLANEASRYPTFRLLMGTEATSVRYGPADAAGQRPVIGVTAHTHHQAVEITADLTVAADGRDSDVRRSAGLVPVDYGVGIDVLWFRLPKLGSPPPDTLGYLNAESMVITIPRSDYYQSGMLIPKGAYPQIQAEGLDAFRARIVRAAPFLAPAVGAVHSWDQVKLLSVQVNRLPTWWVPGLLCIGDAAHAMSPAFGVGVNYAIQDAVAAARILAPPLRAASVAPEHLAAVQQRRLPPVRRMQPIQIQLHTVIAKPGGGGFLRNPMPWWQRIPVALALPVIRRVAARVVGRGFRPERLDGELLHPYRRRE